MGVMHLQSTLSGKTGIDKNGATWLIINVVNRDLSTKDKPYYATLKAFGVQADKMVFAWRIVPNEEGKFTLPISKRINLNAENVREETDLNGDARISYIWSDDIDEVQPTEAPTVVQDVPTDVPFTV